MEGTDRGSWGTCVVLVGLTRSPGAIAFPLCILLLVPLRHFLLPRWFSAKALALLDAPMIPPTDSTAVELGDGTPPCRLWLRMASLWGPCN